MEIQKTLEGFQSVSSVFPVHMLVLQWQQWGTIRMYNQPGCGAMDNTGDF